MPLLRRGVKNIIACVATHADPTALTKEQFATGEFVCVCQAFLRVPGVGDRYISGPSRTAWCRSVACTLPLCLDLCLEPTSPA